METNFDSTCKQHFWFSSDEKHYIVQILKLAEKHPEEVHIIKRPEENDGCIYGFLPKAWIQVRVPRKLNYTEEQRREFGQRMKRLHSNHSTIQEK